MQHLQKTGEGGPFAIQCSPPTVGHSQSASAPIVRKPPSHLARGNTSQTPVYLDRPKFAETLQSPPQKTPGKAARPDSTESSSPSRFSVAPATSPPAVHPLPHRSLRPASRTQTSN